MLKLSCTRVQNWSLRERFKLSCYSKEVLEDMLEDVINELKLSDSMIEEHGPIGTAPAKLVRLVLERKDREILMLKQGFVTL